MLIQSDLQNELSQLQGNLTGILGIILLGSYYLNFGNKITMALFTHCDQSLLGYRTYNSGRNVLLNFIQRLYHVIRLHIPQILILSITAVFLTLMISPDVDRLSMFLVFAAFVSAGIAFCIHSLVLYYLFQPYNSELAVKSVGFTVADMLTYFAVYSISNFQGEHLTLLKIITSSALIYFVVASLLIYFLAPKTFKIRK